MLRLLLLLVISTATQSAHNRAVHPSLNDSAVPFEVKLESGPTDLTATTLWQGTYKTKGSVARFRIELDSSKEMRGGGIRIAFGKGQFLSQPNSDNVALIAALKKALLAKHIPLKPIRLKTLNFEYAVLGHGLNRTADGAFDTNQKGDWITLKVFLGDDEGEVYLNLNPVSGQAEFTIKDQDYGDYVVRKLAQVL